jgi:acetyl-CoA carboxylase carboxyl transferase subunit alpha
MIYYDFEKPIIELEKKIDELQKFSEKEKIDVSLEIQNLEEKLKELKKDIYTNLSSWQRLQIARHPSRPYSADYIKKLFTRFVEIHGDRRFSEDRAMLAGIGYFEDIKVAFIGHDKGRETADKLKRNFGCAHPEGYRKALRLMKMAEKFKLPIISFIDTPGAYPGIGAEERGQAEAIAVNIREMFSLTVPIIIMIIGEGGSGGALGIGVGDRVYILQNAYYSVISPEGCAAILWRDRIRANLACEALKIMPQDLLKLGIVDEIVPEPVGGAHRNFDVTAANIRLQLIKGLNELKNIPSDELLHIRYEKFRQMGIYSTASKKYKKEEAQEISTPEIQASEEKKPDALQIESDAE